MRLPIAARLRLTPLGRWRLALAVALGVLLVWLVGPLTPWRLPGEQRLLPPPGQRWIDTVLAGLSAAAALNAVLCVLLLATSGRWARALPRDAADVPKRARAAQPTAWIVLLLSAAALAGALRWHLAHESLWWDEAWSVGKVIVGEWRAKDAARPEDLEFDAVSWIETLWYYKTPTNHVLYSVAARASLAGWRAASGAAPEAFDEFALRLPACLAALASVLLVGVLVRDLGFPRGGLVAACLLALHPWHVRYGTDGRGYSFVVLGTLAGAWFLLHALRAGRWRDWGGFALSQWVLLWTFPLAVYVPLSLGLSGALACALGRAPPQVRRARFVRLAIASLLAAMAFLQVMAPNLAQHTLRADLYTEPAGLDAAWVRHLWVYLATGLQAHAPRLPDLEFPTLTVLAKTRPWLPWLVYVALPLTAAAGLARAWRRGGAGERAALAGLVLPVPLFLLHRELQGFAVLHRFAVFGLAASVPLLAIGLEGIAAALHGTRAPRAAQPALLVLGLAAFAGIVEPQLRLLTTRPIEPNREVIALLDRAEDRTSGAAIRAGVGLGGDAARVYDPRVREVETPDELAALAAEARAGGRSLLVFYGYGPLNKRRRPELIAPLEDPRLFEPLGRLDGIDSETVYRVLRYTGASLP